MNAQEYLSQIRSINLKIQAINEEIAEIRAALGVQAIDYSKVPGSISGTDKTFKLICDLIDKQDELMEKYISLLDKKQEILSILYRLPKHIYAELLYKRYFEYKKWIEIADEMGYSEEHIKRLHRVCLDEVEKMLLNIMEYHPFY